MAAEIYVSSSKASRDWAVSAWSLILSFFFSLFTKELPSALRAPLGIIPLVKWEERVEEETRKERREEQGIDEKLKSKKVN